jgi:predicted Zn finger-like uncharacterized protein
LKISCPSCEAKYSIGDDKVQGRLAKIRCRKCGADIVIDGRAQPPTVSVGDSAASPETMQAVAAASHSYTIDFGESDQRTMTLEEIVASYNAGYITPESFVWADGMSDWTPLGQVAEIVDALNTAAVSSVQTSSTAAAGHPQTTTATTATATPAPAKAAARATGRGGTDLFGALSRAGGEEDMARQAAVSEPTAHQPATSGARNESSVLFSLSALTSSAKSAPSQSHGLSSSSAASREDSGLIDLKALTAQASSEAAAASSAGVGLSAPSPLGGLGSPLGGLGAPLGGAPAVQAGFGLGAPALADVSYPQKKNRMGLFIGGGLAVGLVAIALVVALKPEPPAPAKVDTTPVIVYKTREPEPVKEAAKPPPTGEPSASVAATAAAPKSAGASAKWRPAPAKAKSSSGGGSKESSSSGASSPAPAPKPASNKCGCAAGDLACNMRCAAKGG